MNSHEPPQRDLEAGLEPDELYTRIRQALEIHKPEKRWGSKNGWSCEQCCWMAGDMDHGYECEHNELWDHKGVDPDHACRTRAALLGVEWE